jgi:betaine-aldehyde dehydrogenase
VLCVLPFDDEADVIAQANDNAYGLALRHLDPRLPQGLAGRRGRSRTGTVWINTYKQFSISTPFGGEKDAGIGREKGREGIRAYMAQKSVYVDLSARPLPWAQLGDA